MERPWVTSPTYEMAIRTVVELRKELGLTQRDVAARIGKPRSFISKVENRERRLDFVEFIALARALGVNPAAMLERVTAALPGPLEF
jgi:transcriptional regulator with XRE-family HTH domain